MKIITLQVNGNTMDFSEQELTAIVEKYYSTEMLQQIPTTKVAQKPTEAAWFEVKPQAIDQKLFKNKRDDIMQEASRQLILEAFAEMKENPEKYGKSFKTMIPKKTWDRRTVAQLKEMSSKLGDHNADWVELALEWAQRIANGEPWEYICNTRDRSNWYRLVVWKNGYARLVGGLAWGGYYGQPVSDISVVDCVDDTSLDHTVPLVVSYEE